MKITISGIALSGKDTTAKLLSEKTGMEVLFSTMKSYARAKGMDILDFEEKVKKDDTGKYDFEMDSWQKEEVAKREDCILDSMLSAYNIPEADVRVWLFAPLEERARRASNRDGISPEEAKKYVENRDKIFRERIQKIYGFDWWNPMLYDICINTAKYRPEEVVGIIMKAMKELK